MSVPCELPKNQESERPNDHFGVICEASPFDTDLASGQGSGLAPDSTCLADIPSHETMIEYRYHLEENLNTQEVSCEMVGDSTHVDYRRGKLPIVVIKLYQITNYNSR